MSVILAVANQKGGVGKTTTTVNLGAGLAKKGHKVLLIDFDPQASLSHFLKLNDKTVETGYVGDWLMKRSSFDQVLNTTTFGNMAVVRSKAELTRDEAFLLYSATSTGSGESSATASMRVLERFVQEIKDQYDYILIDTPPTFSLLFTNCIFACDRVIIPTKLEFLSIRALGPLLARIADMRTYKPDLNVLGILGTLFRVSVKEQLSCLEDVKSKIPEDLFKTLIRQNVTLAESATFGKPIQFFDAGSPGGKDYDALTQEVIERCAAMSPVAVH